MLCGRSIGDGIHEFSWSDDFSLLSAPRRLGHLRSPGEHEGHWDGNQTGEAADPQRRGEATGEGCGVRVAVVEQGVEARGCDG